MRAFVLLVAACASDNKLDRVNFPPEVSIEAPIEGQEFRQGDGLIALRGTATDTYDDPGELVVTWAVDSGEPVRIGVQDDGFAGLEIDATLAIGAHTATLAAVDSDGEGVSATVVFSMAGPLGAPTVTITAPEEGASYAFEESITFTGMAFDETTDAADLTFAWSSDVDGVLSGAITGGGQSALLIATLSIGPHAITLDVTDADGEVGSDTLGIVVEDLIPDPPEPGDLIFSEFMVNPTVADELGEWVELYNTSGSPLDIAGYAFSDDGSDYWVFDTSILVDPHGYIVLCANPDPSKNGGVACDGWFLRNPDGEAPTAGSGHGGGVAIANNDDELRLSDPSALEIDLFDYDDTSDDPIEAGSSFGLDPTRLDGVLNDDIGNWCVQTTLLDGATDPGTPGEPNDPCLPPE